MTKLLHGWFRSVHAHTHTHSHTQAQTNQVFRLLLTLWKQLSSSTAELQGSVSLPLFLSQLVSPLVRQRLCLPSCYGNTVTSCYGHTRSLLLTRPVLSISDICTILYVKTLKIRRYFFKEPPKTANLLIFYLHPNKACKTKC